MLLSYSIGRFWANGPETREAVQQRRKREMEEVSRLDSQEVDDDQAWYIISSSWLRLVP